MLRSGRLDGPQANRRHLRLANGAGYWRTELIAPAAGESPEAGPWRPQAFLVEQDPEAVILPHFHLRDEFQVIVGGDGTFGRRTVRPVTVHYAGRHTGYGPIGAGPQGLWYLSLRAVADPGARFLPEARSEMEPVAKRHLLADPVAPGLDGAGARAEVAAIPPQPDGIAAWFLHVPASAPVEPPAHADGAARFYVVVAGEMQLEGASLPPLATAFATDPGEFRARAGEAGLQLLALQFPC